MGNENWIRTYTIECGKQGSTGFKIGNVDGAERALHVSFSVEKSDTESSNTAKVQIWNLSNDNLKVLDDKDAVLTLSAGYGANTALIILGNVVSATTSPDNADRVTEIEIVDSRTALREANISMSINGKVEGKDLYGKIADAMGMSIVFGKDLEFTSFPNGFVFVGKGKAALQKVATACGHKFTIQNGVIQVTKPGEPINTLAYLLDASSGLLRIPKRITLGESKENKSQTGYEIEYLLNGAIGINDIVQLKSKDVSGYFRVKKVTFDGDNFSGDWICTAQIVEVKQ